MAINKKLIHFKTKENFNKEVAKDNILDTSIVFIQDSKEISTHGTLYKSVNWSILKDYSKEYFTIEALEDGLTAKLSTNACEYCIDNGSWNTLSAGTNTPSINKGQTLSFKGNLTPNSSSGIGTFTISKKCNLKGNIMSLLYGDDFIGQNNLSGKNYAFSCLFKDCTEIVDASKLILPATILANYCYFGMFDYCINLTVAPELPAIILADSCYSNMFQTCTSLTKVPKLPATTLVDYCYYCMFYGCSSLIEASELPATILADYCYYRMFLGCTSLITAPNLPATTLANECYRNMFWGCTSLTKAPILPAATLTNYCYQGMFYGCSQLSNITMLATNINSNNCLLTWVSGVASSGTFVKHKDMISLPTGVSGIPSGWTVENYNN